MILSSKKNVLLVLLLAAAVFAVAVWYRYRVNIAAPAGNNITASSSVAVPATALSVAPKVRGSAQPAYRGEPIATVAEGAMSSGFPESYKAGLRAELRDLAKKVATGDANVDDWMRIGVIKKVLRDFLGARDAWEYAASVYTLNPLPFYNLGDVYGSYLKDFPRAEKNFERAISLEPSRTGFYISLAELYRYFYVAKKNLVVPTIERGLKVVSNDENLLLYLGSYYRDDVKDNAKAIFYFEKVLASDPANSGLKQEIERLKSLQ